MQDSDLCAKVTALVLLGLVVLGVAACTDVAPDPGSASDATGDTSGDAAADTTGDTGALDSTSEEVTNQDTGDPAIPDSEGGVETVLSDTVAGDSVAQDTRDATSTDTTQQETTPTCSPACKNGGTCTSTNVCDCSDTGYEGRLCDTPLCTQSCLNGSTCVAPNVCDCGDTGYTGTRCQTPECTVSCLNGGQCLTPNVCSCTGTGYEGSRCETPICAQSCLNGGTCSAPSTCDCEDTGYSGSRCQTPICATPCENGGVCLRPDVCDCASTGYEGATCTIPVCQPACLSGAICLEPNKCNAPPVVSDVTISPSTVLVAGQRLTCQYAYVDADLFSEDNSVVEWLVNGQLVAGVAGAPFVNYQQNDMVTCRVLPSDGLSLGTPVTSAPVKPDLASGFVRIDAGTFTMGSPQGELGKGSFESQRQVTLTRGFWLSTTETTNSLWESVIGSSAPSEDQGRNRPVADVNWWSSVSFANTLSIRAGLTPCYTLTGCNSGTVAGGDLACSGVTFVGLACTGFRLPTEAEWEYAARSGTATATYNGDLTATDCTDTTHLPIAWSDCNSHNANDVAQKGANQWGLYDMLGNVREWVWDLFGFYLTISETDPLGPSTGSKRVLRGGSFVSSPRNLRAAYRDGSFGPEYHYGTAGFRLARTVP